MKKDERRKNKRKHPLKALISVVALSMALSPVNVFATENESNTDNELKHYFGDVVNTGKDNGYSKEKEITKKDPHYGWKLGEFYISGYTSETDENSDNPVFLKTVGDTVTLWFTLEQDIDNLNPDDDGESSLSISEDKNGYDQNFGIEKTNFGKGALIIKYTDSQHKDEDPVIYTDYLSALKEGAATKVELFEEGDYEVALDYEIKNNPRKIGPVSIIPTYTNYRISFKFSVRNGNCMVYPFDVSTGEELTNTAITENGFKLDLAKSRYLEVNVKKEVLKEGANGLTEDTRFNKPAKEGDEYTEEGVYTITVKNKYTDQETTKQIYVGTNDILKAYVTTGKSISEIERLIDEGATIEDDGTITKASVTIADAVNEEESEEEVTTDSGDAEDTLVSQMSQENTTDAHTSNRVITSIVIACLVVVTLCLFVSKKKKHKTEEGDER